METFYLGDNKHKIKTEWPELTDQEFIFLASLLGSYKRNELDHEQVRQLMAMRLLGYNPRRLRGKKNQQFSENIVKIAEMLTFFFRVEYSDMSKIDKLSKKNRAKVLKHLPEDLEDAPEIRAVRKLDKWFVVDACFAKNLLPVIKKGRKKFTGYTFEQDGTVLDTNLTAAQFVKSQELYTEIMRNPQVSLLDRLVANLYQDGEYSEKRASELVPVMHDFPLDIKQAVVLNFGATLEFIARIPKYGILFNSTSKSKKKKQSMYAGGFSDTIYSLSKSGYGDKDVIKNTPLLEYLDMIIKDIRDTVKSLQKMEKSESDIASELKMSLSQVNQLLS